MRRTSRSGLLAAAITFARSPQGQRMIAEARRRYDTPANRAKARQLLTQVRSGRKR